MADQAAPPRPVVRVEREFRIDEYDIVIAQGGDLEDFLDAIFTGLPMVPIGSMIGNLGGGWINEWFDWRTAFVVVGLPGVALALYDHWFEIKIKAPGPIGIPRHGFDRVLSIYNLRDDGWRQSLYAQCPLGPTTYVEAMTEKLVKPDFDEFYEDIQSRELNDPRLENTGD